MKILALLTITLTIGLTITLTTVQDPMEGQYQSTLERLRDQEKIPCKTEALNHHPELLLVKNKMRRIEQIESRIQQLESKLQFASDPIRSRDLQEQKALCRKLRKEVLADLENMESGEGLASR